MNLFLIVRQTLRESYRGRELVVSCLLFVVVFGASAGLLGWATSGEVTDNLIWTLLAMSSVLVPITGLTLGQPAVSGKREDGRLRLVFGQPVSRATVVLGAYIAKAIVLVVVLVGGLVAAVAAIYVLDGSLELWQVVEFGGFTLLVGLAYLSIAIGISAASRSTRWSTLSMLSILVLFVVLWRVGPFLVFYVSDGFAVRQTYPEWIDLVTGLSPSVAYERLFEFYGFGPFSASAYTDTAFSLSVLVGWIVLPPLLGIWQFTRTDL